MSTEYEYDGIWALLVFWIEAPHWHPMMWECLCGWSHGSGGYKAMSYLAHPKAGFMEVG